jgi:acyl-coenzyme A synthetase/AMP-(fatty) acid ligase
MSRFGPAEGRARQRLDAGGDAVHGDDDGWLFFHGRGDDLIKGGGYRIGPAGFEAALLGVVAPSRRRSRAG